MLGVWRAARLGRVAATRGQCDTIGAISLRGTSMKILSATATAIVAVVLLCTLSTGGQQQSEKGQQQTPGFTPIAPKRKAPATREDARHVAHLPDGRVVRFPAQWDERGSPVSTSQEEIDALAKRIAEGAVDLPPGAKVIGWEPVEGASSLLPSYEQRVETIPTTKGKLEALANAAGILQTQISGLQTQLAAESAGNTAGFRSTDKTLNNHAENFDALAAQVAYLAQQDQIEKHNLKRDLDDLKQELAKFKEAACPILLTANVGWRTQMQLDSACGRH